MKYRISLVSILSQVVLGAAFLIVVGERAFALPSPLVVQPGKILRSLHGGVSIGGRAGEEFSLLGLKTEPMAVSDSSRGGERITLFYGDKNGQAQKGEPGFFHVLLDRASKRVVIDLAQVHKTTVDPQKLARILSQSKIVESSEMTTDPVDGTTNIILNLNRPVRLKVGSQSEGQAAIIVELEIVDLVGG